MDWISSINSFVAVVNNQSFSRAARQLNISVSKVSQKGSSLINHQHSEAHKNLIELEDKIYSNEPTDYENKLYYGAMSAIKLTL